MQVQSTLEVNLSLYVLYYLEARYLLVLSDLLG